jgi:glutathione-specific gamma-glutamylcyclotransferase
MPPSSSLEGDFSESEEYWIFGYGSLIWKFALPSPQTNVRPPPHFDRRIPGFITSYIRRFWQSSIDHRGTPEAPGRVVTLIPRDQWSGLDDEHDSPEDEVTWGTVLWELADIGVVYRIEKSHAAEVKAYLDHREINGYSIHYVPVYLSSTAGKPVVERAVVYIGTHDNPAFVGPMGSIDDLARHIFKSQGPSGENKE